MQRRELELRWLDVPFRPDGAFYQCPPLSLNWTVRGGLYVRRQLLRDGWKQLHAAFVHTLTIGLLASPFYRAVPTVISVDATPLNIDSLRFGYAHRRQSQAVEYLKKVVVRRALRLATAYVSWSEWAKLSLIHDYGVDGDKIAVIPPGTDVEKFRKAAVRRDGPPRILFVGGDFQRKGGDLLLDAYKRRLGPKAELHLATARPVRAPEGVIQHCGLPPNSEELLDLYRSADIFALPTRADCLAVVLAEAMAASLPIVTTNVGAHEEAVQDGCNGLIVPPEDIDALADALERLVDDERLRREMGEAGRKIAEQRFDAQRNADRIVAHMKTAAGVS